MKFADSAREPLPFSTEVPVRENLFLQSERLSTSSMRRCPDEPLHANPDGATLFVHLCSPGKARGLGPLAIPLQPLSSRMPRTRCWSAKANCPGASGLRTGRWAGEARRRVRPWS